MTLSLKMNNAVEAVGYQCDIYLPDGISFVKDEDDDYLVELSTERTTYKNTDYFNYALQKDGALRILCSSTKSKPFSGNSGEVARITLKISDDLPEGSYPIIMKKIIISDTESKTYKVDSLKSSIQVYAYQLGDANGDGDINVGDFTAIANAVLDNPPAVFVERAADVNEDNSIDVGDLTAVSNLILYGTEKSASAARMAAKSFFTYSVEDGNTLYVNDFSSENDSEVVLSVNMKNNVSACGYQFDLYLPEGVSVKKDEDDEYMADLSLARTTRKNTDYFNYAVQKDGAFRVLCSSTKSKAFKDNDGEVCTITLSVADTVTPGDYTIALKNIVISDTDSRTYKTDETNNRLTVTANVTGIDDIYADSSTAPVIYDLQGRRVLVPSSGNLYIVNGRKVLWQ